VFRRGKNEAMVNGQDRSLLTVVLVVAGMVIVLAGLKLGSIVLGPIFLSMFFAIILTPVLRWFTRRGLSYQRALVLTMFLVVVLGAAVIAFLVLTLIGLKDQIASYESSFTQTAHQYSSLFQFLSSNVRLTQITTVLIDGVFVLFGTLFLLWELPRFHASMVARLGVDHAIVRGTEELYRDIIDYFIVRIKINFYVSIGAVAVLLVLGIPYALLWGLMAFALSFVPYIGYLVAAIPPILLAWVQYGLVGAVAVLLLYGLINVIAENLIFPQLASKALAVPIYVVFVSVFFWGWVLGFSGVLMAVPLTMAAMIFLGQFEETAWLVPFFRGGRSKERKKGLLRRSP
jgi:AI-2 transport protein TqsA